MADVDVLLGVGDDLGFTQATEARRQYERLREATSVVWRPCWIDSSRQGFEWGVSDGNGSSGGRILIELSNVREVDYGKNLHRQRWSKREPFTEKSDISTRDIRVHPYTRSGDSGRAPGTDIFRSSLDSTVSANGHCSNTYRGDTSKRRNGNDPEFDTFTYGAIAEPRRGRLH